MEKTIAAVDLGSYKIKMVTARIDRDGNPRFLGFDEAASRGVSNGNVIDLAEASGVIEGLIKRAKEKYEARIFKVIISVGGIGFSSERSQASDAFRGGPRELFHRDIEKITQIARNMSLSFDRYIMHEIIEDYILDGQPGIRNPVGLFARKVQVKLYTLFYNLANIQNAVTCLNYAGCDVERVVFSGLADAACLLEEDELKNGVILLDFGHETAKITIAHDNKIKFCKTLKAGSGDITKAISSKFKITTDSAEEIKLASGVFREPSANETESLKAGSQEIPKIEIEKVTREKTSEILKAINREIKAGGLIDFVKSGMVVSGGGIFMEGMEAFMGGAFGFSVKTGIIKNASSGMYYPPITFAPGVGSLMYYAREMRGKAGGLGLKNPVYRLTHKVVSFLNDYF